MGADPDDAEPIENQVLRAAAGRQAALRAQDDGADDSAHDNVA